MLDNALSETSYWVGTDDTRWVLDQLKRFTYRPKWYVTAADRHYGSSPDIFSPFNMTDVEVRVWFEAEDSRHPHETVKVGDRRHVPSYVLEERNEELFAQWFQRWIISMEEHESREWLRRDGKIYDDPHK
jgi:hypothetical protein